MDNDALILEGGGMRGAYTAGVLDAFLDHDIDFDRCYAVSAGACHAMSFLSKQRGRAFKVSTDYLDNWRYMSKRSLFLTGDMIGNKFVYHTIPEKLVPFDNEAFMKNKTKLYCVVTNVKTGKAEYLLTKDGMSEIDNVRASASLPLISRFVKINGEKYLDGGIVDPIPVKRSFDDGCKKAVVILTQHKGFVKKITTSEKHSGLIYWRYPEFVAKIKTRYMRYNESLSYIDEEEAKGNVIVIRPKKPVEVKRIDKDKEKMRALYEEGYRDGEERIEEIKKFLNK